MCGRFTLTPHAAEILDAFPELAPPDDVVPRYNVAPTDMLLTVTERDGRRAMERLRWGLIPSWAKDSRIGSTLINARADALDSKPAFRNAFKKRRCLVLADGFFEWRKEGTKRRPFYFRVADARVFAFAGLWEVWKDPQGVWVPSCTIVTTEPNDLVRPLHDRMPVILPRDAYDDWLNVELLDDRRLGSLLMPYPADKMTMREVSSRVNSVRNDDPACIAPLESRTEPLPLF